jgi:ribosomal protein S18
MSKPNSKSGGADNFNFNAQNAQTVIKKKYCRFKKHNIKYVDYKDANFLLKFFLEESLVLQTNINVKLQLQ